MRKKGSRNGVTALAVAGTNVVVLGWDMSEDEAGIADVPVSRSHRPKSRRAGFPPIENSAGPRSFIETSPPLGSNPGR